MTDTTFLPPGHDAEDPGRRMREHVVNSVLAEAGEAGRGAAEWVWELAGRQADWRHRIVLERAAAAVERASGREVVPGGHGELAEELAHDLAADVITGSASAPGLPELTVRERLTLVAVCALAAAMPAAVLGDVEHEIPPLASTVDAAHAAGRGGRPGRTGEVAAVRRGRTCGVRFLGRCAVGDGAGRW